MEPQKSPSPRPNHHCRILVVGTDGSGKTTLCQALLDRLGNRAAHVYLGMRDYVSLPARRLSRSQGRLGRLLFQYLAYPLDIALRLAAAPRRPFLVMERIPAYAFQDRRSLLRLIHAAVIPRPTLAVFLNIAPDVAQKRRPGNDPVRAARDQAKISRALQNIRPRRQLDLDTTTLGPDQVLERILREIEA